MICLKLSGKLVAESEGRSCLLGALKTSSSDGDEKDASL